MRNEVLFELRSSRRCMSLGPCRVVNRLDKWKLRYARAKRGEWSSAQNVGPLDSREINFGMFRLPNDFELSIIHPSTIR